MPCCYYSQCPSMTLHDPPHSGHLGKAKTLERLCQSQRDVSTAMHAKVKDQLNEPSCKVIKLEHLWTVSIWTSLAPFRALRTSTFLSSLTSSPDGLKPSQFQLKEQRRQPGSLCMTLFPSLEPLHTNQGRHFESFLFRSVCKLLQIAAHSTQLLGSHLTS